MALFSSLAVVESLSVAAAAASSSSSRGFQEPGSIHSAAARVWSGAGRMRGGAASSLVVRGSSSGTSKVTLLDYGAGNVRSIRNAIHLLGFNIREVTSPEDIGNAKRLIFPGVGSFKAAMDVLNSKGLAESLCAYIREDRPFLGICLGLQLLFDYSEEGFTEGLGIIPGTVARFDSSAGLRVPHIGWNGLQLKQPSQLLEGINGRHVYFVHSYRGVACEENKDWILATSRYGDDFISAIRKGNIHALQFHPEKSGVIGLDILRRFLDGGHSEAAKVCSTCVVFVLKWVIACLDVRSNDAGDLVVTKGDQYDVREQTSDREVRNLGKPVELAGRYFKDGADEVTFLNITGFRDFPLGDMPMLEVLRQASEHVFVPLTVGGGIHDFTDAHGRFYSSLEVAAEYFRSGADKISIGSDAVYAAEEYLHTGVKTGKSSLEQISYVYGNQAVVVSIDPRRIYVNDPSETPFRTIQVSKPGPNGEKYAWYQCTVKGGREGRQIGAYELSKAVEELGAGEILLNCIDCDGQGQGYDIELVQLVSEAVTIPVIASSGAGRLEHFSEVFHKTAASAALAAGIFHREEISITSVKEHMVQAGVDTRLL
ncbi:unnamed protein product [Sphagnum jensenii]|uniref:Imidazole glycerol phosphate synthase hisHF n=1 Tax=Sphagnum jensenii TaxID=128206 RepID=A0ABP1B4P7_9BRYO